MGRPVIDLSGQKFGRLTVIRPTSKRYNKSVINKCVCECGTTCLVDSGALKMGHKKSCGCLLTELRQNNSYSVTHGKSYTRTYKTWDQMIQRCTNENNPKWEDYGGRGITVCSRWLNSFESFLADMGERPIGKEIDRRKNNRGYRKSNCRWVTRRTNCNNTRVSVRVWYRGKVRTIANVAEKMHVSYNTVYGMLVAGKICRHESLTN